MELTQEEKRVLIDFSGIFTNTEDRQIDIREHRYRHKILLECMSKLLKHDIKINMDSYLVGVWCSSDSTIFWIKDHNNDFNLTLAKACLYAIKEMR